ncbi:MAG: cell division protein ZapA [Thermodesulfobacteriota bacterium]
MTEAASLKRVPVDVLGHRYFVRTDGDEEQIRQVAEYVNKKSREVMETSGTVNTVDLLIKVAMNLADELFKERSASEALRQRMAQEAQELIREIEAHL